MLCRLFLRTSIGTTMGTLLPATLDESQAIADHDGGLPVGEHLRPSPCSPTGRPAPAITRPSTGRWAAAIPNATLLPIERHGHDGINRAPATLVDAYATFLA